MPVSLLAVIFVVLFGVMIAAALGGAKYWESRRKRQFTRALGAPELQQPEPARILRDPAAEASGRSTAFAGRIRQQIEQAALDWTPERLLGMSAGLALCGVLIGSQLNIALYTALSCIVLACVLGALPYVVLQRKRKQRLGRFEEQFAEALDFLARSMKAGHAFPVSLQMTAEEAPDPLAGEFRKAVTEHNLGAPLELALRNMAGRVPLLDVQFFVSAVLLQRETGGNLSEILSKLAQIIRERFQLRGQVKAAAAHGKITGTILTLMPILLTAALSVVAPGYFDSMLNDGDGRYLVIGSVAAQILGYWSIRKIVNIEV
jgi:tight adherence protein B